ncbi:hypothetical protein D7044_19575 [Micromonospora musae]|uniref:NACHT domain-containing protein n=1 Tax=Micromonospora musae TaxID=1894970 RepID=A0A3A9XZN5_9ACTN|nr:hypothetical protein D7044_19575 [Micromonospora musae]
MWKWGLLGVVAGLSAAGTAWVWTRYDFEKVNWAWGVVAGVIAVYVVLDQIFLTRPATPVAVAAHRQALADELAELVRRDPADDALLRTVDEPYPLPVRWRNAPERLQPSWRSIGRSSDAGLLDLAGRDGTLWSHYRRVPSGRLLLLGPAGSGKSIIALRMARESPVHREPDAPVPVVLSADSWDPDRLPFHDWLVDRIGRRYPQLAADSPRRDAVLRDLVETDLVVPVLDGLDEVPEDRLIACLEELNALPTQRFVLTCRTSVYERYLSQGEKLRGTAVVILEPPAPAEVADYLVDAAPYHQVDNWSTVAGTLDDDPELAGALSTPLMVAMARSAFDAPGTDPQDLVPLARERGRRSVEDQLLTRAVDAALRSRRGGQGLRRWAPARARAYLSYLAAHLESLDLREFRWWELPAALPRPFWGLVDGLRAGLAVWLAVALARDALTGTAALVDERWVADLLEWTARRPDVLTAAAVVLVAAFALLRRGGGSVPPVRVAFTGGPRALAMGMRDGLARGAASGSLLTWALLWPLPPTPQLVAVLERVPGLPPWSVPTQAGVVLAVVVCAYNAVRSALRVDVAAPVDDLAAARPDETVRADRAATIAATVPAVAGSVLQVLVLMAALRLTGVLSGMPPLPTLLYAGVGLGLGRWLLSHGRGAWVRFAVARGVLALRRRTPLQLLSFLSYAEAVGLLRYGAGGYRFRHGRLQGRLAARSAIAQRGTRLSEEFGLELARAGYWTEALAVFADVTRTRVANIGPADDLTAAALRRALLAGAAAREWALLAELLALMPPPAANASTVEIQAQRELVARLVAGRAPLVELVSAAEELCRREEAAGTADLVAEEFLAVVCYAEGDVDAARARLARLWDTRSTGNDLPMPIVAGLLARLLLDGGDPIAALTVCHQEMLFADQPPHRSDLFVLVQRWSWSVEVMRRVTDERAELHGRVRRAMVERRGRPIELGRRELAEIGLQASHAVLGHPTLGPLAVAASRRFASALADPNIVVRTVNRSAPMWRAG